MYAGGDLHNGSSFVLNDAPSALSFRPEEQATNCLCLLAQLLVRNPAQGGLYLCKVRKGSAINRSVLGVPPCIADSSVQPICAPEASTRR